MGDGIAHGAQNARIGLCARRTALENARNAAHQKIPSSRMLSRPDLATP
jgi:hypothetical protein